MSKARFHFEVFWPKFEDYDEFIVQAWKRPTVACDPLTRLDLMLRNLVRQLQSWSETRIGQIKTQLLMGRELVLRLDCAQERRHLSEAENALRKHLKMRCLGRLRSVFNGDRRNDMDSLFALVSWQLWKERNARCFRESTSTVGDLLHIIKAEADH